WVTQGASKAIGRDHPARPSTSGQDRRRPSQDVPIGSAARY
ncbi:MAG: hypothetical protein AVDCRST_MAG59-5058, partial [uncultured Thermomicrobiales bacterium]